MNNHEHGSQAKTSKGATVIKSIIGIVLATLLFFGANLAVTIGYMSFAMADMMLSGEIPQFPNVTEADLEYAMIEVSDRAINDALQISLVSNLIFILILCLSYTVRKKSPFKSLNVSPISPIRYISFAAFGIVLQIVLSISANLILAALGGIFPAVNAAVEAHNAQYVAFEYETNLVMEIISAGLVTGIAEELFFRGVCVGYLRRFMNPYLAVILSSLIFGLAHPSIISMVYATLIGILLGVLYIKYDSVVPSIICHIFFNTTSSLISLIPEDQSILLLVLYIISVPVLLFLFISIFVKYPTISDVLFDDKNRIKPRNPREAAVISKMNSLKASGEISEADYKRLDKEWNRAKKEKKNKKIPSRKQL